MAKKDTDSYEIQIEQLRYALDNVPAYVYIKDKDSHYLYANKLTLELFGCSEKELLGRGDSDFFPEKTVSRLREVDQRVLQGEKTKEEIIVDIDDSNQIVYWEVKTPIYKDGDSSEIIGILGISTDISERKKLEKQLIQAAATDSLTGLPNRREFIERLKHAMQLSKRHNTHGAVIFLDLDKFKQLNDSYGHSIGDQYLVEVARRINQQVRESDTVARFGGDEFVVLLEELGSEKELALENTQLIANEVLNSLNTSFKFSEIVYHGSVSAGITLFLGTQQSVEEILAEADKLMYENKRQSHKPS